MHKGKKKKRNEPRVGVVPRLSSPSVPNFPRGPFTTSARLTILSPSPPPFPPPFSRTTRLFVVSHPIVDHGPTTERQCHAKVRATRRWRQGPCVTVWICSVDPHQLHDVPLPWAWISIRPPRSPRCHLHFPTARASPSLTEFHRKLVIIGDGACGKTSLLSVFTLGYFPTVRSPPHARKMGSLTWPFSACRSTMSVLPISSSTLSSFDARA